MQITINVPDNLPPPIVQQYINTIEAQMRLIAELAVNKIANEPKKTLTTKQVSFEQLLQIANECSALPVLGSRSADEILGYDNSPCGLFGNKKSRDEKSYVSTAS
jgi:hypothetical protein